MKWGFECRDCPCNGVWEDADGNFFCEEHKPTTGMYIYVG